MNSRNTITATAMALCAIATTVSHAGTWNLRNSKGFYADVAGYETVPEWNAYLEADTPQVTTHVVVSKATYPSASHQASTHVTGTWTPSYPGESFPSGNPILVLDVEARLDGGAGASGAVWLGNILLANLTNQQGSWVPIGTNSAFGTMRPYAYPDGTLLDPNWNGVRTWDFNFTTFRADAAGVSPSYGTTQVRYANGTVVYN